MKRVTQRVLLTLLVGLSLAGCYRTVDRNYVAPAPRTVAPRMAAPRNAAPRTTAPRAIRRGSTTRRANRSRTAAPRTGVPRTNAPRTAAPRHFAPETSDGLSLPRTSDGTNIPKNAAPGTARNRATNRATNRTRNHHVANKKRNHATDHHHKYVSGLGFTNVVNPHGTTHAHRYRLNHEHARSNEVFHQWRHAWVEPSQFRDKEIDVYHYTGTLNGEQRNIYVLSHNGNVIGGYHHAPHETIEHARILDNGSYTSRLANDFRSTWNDLFGIYR